jgi:hypothetical protein
MMMMNNDKLEQMRKCDTRNPDGIGEGWRLLNPGEVRQAGDEGLLADNSGWEQIEYTIGRPVPNDMTGRFRRRIF